MLVDDPVKRVDTMTMAWGLEGRVPFLDHEFVELAATCPPELKLAQVAKVFSSRRRGRCCPPRSSTARRVTSRSRASATSTAGYSNSSPMRARSAHNRGLYDADVVAALLAAPNETRTTLGSNSLWQLAMLEMWLQAMETAGAGP